MLINSAGRISSVVHNFRQRHSTDRIRDNSVPAPSKPIENTLWWTSDLYHIVKHTMNGLTTRMLTEHNLSVELHKSFHQERIKLDPLLLPHKEIIWTWRNQKVLPRPMPDSQLYRTEFKQKSAFRADVWAENAIFTSIAGWKNTPIYAQSLSKSTTK